MSYYKYMSYSRLAFGFVYLVHKCTKAHDDYAHEYTCEVTISRLTAQTAANAPTFLGAIGF